MAEALSIRQELQKYKSAYLRGKARAREEGQRMARIGVTSVLGAGGGAMAGVLRAKMPNIPGTEIPSDAALGAVLCGLAAADILGDYGDEGAAFGSGLVAARACTIVEAALK